MNVFKELKESVSKEAKEVRTGNSYHLKMIKKDIDM